jgi:hypothetical protein
MTHVALSIVFLGFLFGSVAEAKEPGWVRTPRGYARDVRRARHRSVLDGRGLYGRRLLRTIGRSAGARYLLKPLVKIHGRRRKPKAPEVVEHFAREGTRTVSLGNGVSLQMRVAKGHVKRLMLRSGKRQYNLLPADVASLEIDAYPGALVSMHAEWPGPFNRLSVLAWLHELGHLEHFRSLEKKQRSDLKTADGLMALGTPLSIKQKRMILGAERLGWANAFRQLRRIRKLGIPLLEDVPNPVLRRVAHGFLDGYARGLDRRESWQE